MWTEGQSGVGMCGWVHTPTYTREGRRVGARLHVRKERVADHRDGQQHIAQRPVGGVTFTPARCP